MSVFTIPIRIYNNFSLHNKIFIVIAMSLMIFAGIITFIINQYYTSTLINKSIIENEQKLLLIREGIESNFDNLIYMTKLTLLDETVQDYASVGKGISTSEKKIYSSLLEQQFNLLMENNPFLVGVSAYYFLGDVFTSTSINSNLLKKEIEELLVHATFTYGQQPEILDTKPVQYYSKAYDTKIANVISIRSIIVSYSTAKIAGFLQFDVDEQILSDTLLKKIYDPDNQTYIVNSENLVMCSFNKDSLYTYVDMGKELHVYPDTFSKLVRIDNKQYVVTEIKLSDMERTIINFLPLDVINNDILGLQIIIIVIIIAFVFILSFFIYLVVQKITSPLVKLTESMNEIGNGNFLFQVSVDGNDEVAKLSMAFNAMMKRISTLMSRIKKEQRIKRKYALRAVMEQIKPHFLYNTLDNICSLIMLDLNTEAYNTSKALALFYKKSLSKGSTIISVADEIEIIKNYLFIQSIRFKDKFDYEIEVDESLFQYRIPKMLLQPLVENAIIHGVNSLPIKGHIKICGKKNADYITFDVFDTGLGFNEDILIKVENKINFGINYVIQRLSEYHDNKCRFTAKNLPTGGAVVSVTIKTIDGYKNA